MIELKNKEEAAKMLGVSPHSIPHIIRDGLQFVRVGKRRVMFRPEDVLAYIEKKINKPGTRNNHGQE
jgi:excisionase family DNA binding protein